MTNKSLSLIAQVVGSLTVILGSLFYFNKLEWAMYLFAFGAFILIFHQLYVMLRQPATDFRLQRIQRMQLMVTLVLAVAVYSMVEGTTLWIPAVLIYALVSLFLSFRS